MNDKEIRKLALDIANNQVFGSWMIKQDNILQTVFMPLIFMDKEQKEDLVKKEIVHMYEYYSEAGPRAINGCPIFFSMGLITKTEMEKLGPMVDDIVAKQKEFVEGEGEESPPEGTAIQVR